VIRKELIYKASLRIAIQTLTLFLFEASSMPINLFFMVVSATQHFLIFSIILHKVDYFWLLSLLEGLPCIKFIGAIECGICYGGMGHTFNVYYWSYMIHAYIDGLYQVACKVWSFHVEAMSQQFN
jgi:hypothetical protein